MSGTGVRESAGETKANIDANRRRQEHLFVGTRIFQRKYAFQHQTELWMRQVSWRAPQPAHPLAPLGPPSMWIALSNSLLPVGHTRHLGELVPTVVEEQDQQLKILC